MDGMNTLAAASDTPLLFIIGVIVIIALIVLIVAFIYAKRKSK